MKFVKGVVSLKDLPEDDLPQIAFLGRSNVGKSSLLNVLFGKKIVKVSSTPGKTRELNFFSVNEAFYIVDLPGVGYAKVSEKKREEMEKSIRDYVERAKNLRGIVYLVDIRHGARPIDLLTVESIRAIGRPVLIVASKRDKVNSSELSKNRALISSQFGLEELPLAVSALKKIGVEELWKEILSAVSETFP